MKTTYRIIKNGENYIIRKAEPVNGYGARDYKYFNGYDFMGSVNWEKDMGNVSEELDWTSATATMHDLMAAD